MAWFTPTPMEISAIEQIETAFLIHPHVLPDFLDYNDFVVETEALIEELGTSRAQAVIKAIRERYTDKLTAKRQAAAANCGEAT